MAEGQRYVVAYVPDGPCAVGGLRWCVAVERNGDLHPVAWTRSVADAQKVWGIFVNDAGDSMLGAQTQTGHGKLRRHVEPHREREPVRPPLPLSLLEWLVLVGSLLAAAGVAVVLEHFSRPPP